MLGHIGLMATGGSRRQAMAIGVAMALLDIAERPEGVIVDPSPAQRRRLPDVDPEIPAAVHSRTTARNARHPLGEGVDTMVVTRFQDGTTFVEAFDGISPDPITYVRLGHMGPYEMIHQAAGRDQDR